MRESYAPSLWPASGKRTAEDRRQTTKYAKYSKKNLELETGELQQSGKRKGENSWPRKGANGAKFTINRNLKAETWDLNQKRKTGGKPRNTRNTRKKTWNWRPESCSKAESGNGLAPMKAFNWRALNMDFNYLARARMATGKLPMRRGRRGYALRRFVCPWQVFTPAGEIMMQLPWVATH